MVAESCFKMLDKNMRQKIGTDKQTDIQSCLSFLFQIKIPSIYLILSYNRKKLPQQPQSYHICEVLKLCFKLLGERGWGMGIGMGDLLFLEK